jgi:hypothetical protein
MNKRDARRAAARDARQRQREEKLREELRNALIVLLTRYMKLHYGNPATGRTSTVLNGPVIARLSAAASLHALLILEAV